MRTATTRSVGATAGAAAPISALASAMLYAGTSKPAMGALPEESLKDKVLRGIDFGAPSANSQLLEQMSQDATMKAGGGMMNMNEMIRPIGMQNGGDPVQELKNEMLKAMTRKEGERRADMNTGNPEMERMSTYGEMPQFEIYELDMNDPAPIIPRPSTMRKIYAKSFKQNLSGDWKFDEEMFMMAVVDKYKFENGGSEKIHNSRIFLKFIL